MAQQIPLNFPSEDLSFDALAVSAANRPILAAVRRVERWPQNIFCLIGAPKSGLTTLLRAWCQERGGAYLSMASDATRAAATLARSEAQNDLAIDRADLLQDDQALLLALSAAKRNTTYLLLSAQTAPAQWPLVSADLLSRLKSTPILKIPAPDEALLRGRLRQGFEKAYLHLTQNVEDYLVSRLGLDYSMLENAIDKLAGEAADRPVTIPLARSVLGFAEGDDADFVG